MIIFKDNNGKPPYQLLKQKYDQAYENKQKNIEAICISSYNTIKSEVDSRFVNLKFINNEEFIFFSNYNSPKGAAFNLHDQIAALIYWSSINVQIRMKAKIKKTSYSYNKIYFSTRSKEKNALAISSNQSRRIDSFDKVQENYNKTLKNDDLSKCPDYWGGYSFSPYEIEFWEGNEFRLNKRNLYKKDNNAWRHFILEP